MEYRPPVSKIFTANGDLWDYEQVSSVATNVIRTFLDSFGEPSDYLPKTANERRLYVIQNARGRQSSTQSQAADVLGVFSSPEPLPRLPECILLRKHGVSLEFQDDVDVLDENNNPFSIMACRYDDKGVWNTDGTRYKEPLRVSNEPSIILQTEPRKRVSSVILEVTEAKLRDLVERLAGVHGVTVSDIPFPGVISTQLNQMGFYTVRFDERFILRRDDVKVELDYADHDEFMK